MSPMERRPMIEASHTELSVVRQCQLLNVNRSTWYYQPVPISAEELAIMKRLDELYTAHPFLGARKLTYLLTQEGYGVNHKRVSRLMREMGLEAIYPKPKTSITAPENKIYPYLLRNVSIVTPDQVWATDITYIRMHQGFIYLSAILDWFSRYIIAWGISISMDLEFCLDVLGQALALGTPNVFNTDQGSQYTSPQHTGMLETAGIEVSMDGRGRYLDNIFTERLWRTIKYEEVYLKDYESIQEARSSLKAYIQFYNLERPHQALGYQTPYQVYQNRSGLCREAIQSPVGLQTASLHPV
ncbi:MAG: IS3 family transposase [Proteobacteria bacterium]|nr:IS3 family transposase [Pseudomonadota bacterium]